MTGLFGIINAAILADSTLSGLVNNQVYTFVAPDNKTPPYIVIQHSGNSPSMTAGQIALENPHVTLNAYVQGLDGTTLKALFDAIKALLDHYNEQSAGVSYDISRIFDMPMLDEDGQLMWTFEYKCLVVES